MQDISKCLEKHCRLIRVIILDLLKEVCVESRYLCKHKIFRSWFFCCSMAKLERFILGSKSNAEIWLIHNICNVYVWCIWCIHCSYVFLLLYCNSAHFK